MAHLLGEVLGAAATLTPAAVAARRSGAATGTTPGPAAASASAAASTRDAAAWLARAVDDAARSLAEVPLVFLLDAVRMLKRAADWRAGGRRARRGSALHPREPRLHREAAILYEHRLADLARALHHAEALGDPRRLARLLARRDSI